MSRLDFINLDNRVGALEAKLDALIKALSEQGGPVYPVKPETLTLKKGKAA